MPSDSLYDAFAVTAPGLESVTASELKMLRVNRPHTVEGGVEFHASRPLLYSTNLLLRTASRVIVRVARFRASGFAELERRAGRIAWETIVPPGGRVRLRVTCRKSRLYHSDAVGDRVFNAIAARTSVTSASKTPDSERSPDDAADDAQLLIVRLDRDEVTISADSSGPHLHRRGYRQAVTQAPLRETLAAAMLLASGWDDSCDLLDPFCGSGTVAIEAALIARRIAPGINRGFRFMSWPDFDDAAWQDILERARQAERPAAPAPIRGSDRSGWAMRAARANAQRAGVADDVAYDQCDATELAPADHSAGWIVTNPPYGVRLGARDELRALYADFGATLRKAFSRWHLGVLSTDRRLDAQLRLPTLEKFQTTNGGLRVHFHVGTIP